MVYFCKRRYFFTRSVYPTGFMQFFLNLAALKGASGFSFGHLVGFVFCLVVFPSLSFFLSCDYYRSGCLYSFPFFFIRRPCKMQKVF